MQASQHKWYHTGYWYQILMCHTTDSANKAKPNISAARFVL